MHSSYQKGFLLDPYRLQEFVSSFFYSKFQYKFLRDSSDMWIIRHSIFMMIIELCLVFEVSSEE